MLPMTQQQDTMAQGIQRVLSLAAIQIAAANKQMDNAQHGEINASASSTSSSSLSESGSSSENEEEEEEDDKKW